MREEPFATTVESLSKELSSIIDEHFSADISSEIALCQKEYTRRMVYTAEEARKGQEHIVVPVSVTPHMLAKDLMIANFIAQSKKAIITEDDLALLPR